VHFHPTAEDQCLHGSRQYCLPTPWRQLTACFGFSPLRTAGFGCGFSSTLPLPLLLLSLLLLPLLLWWAYGFCAGFLLTAGLPAACAEADGVHATGFDTACAAVADCFERFDTGIISSSDSESIALSRFFFFFFLTGSLAIFFADWSVGFFPGWLAAFFVG
jgi:hypothetical protein